jgi:hypothetical protein
MTVVRAFFGPAADPVLIRSHHPRAEFVEDLKRRLIARQTKLSLKLHGRHAGCLAGHQIGRPKPLLSGVCERAMTVPTVRRRSRLFGSRRHAYFLAVETVETAFKNWEGMQNVGR